MDEARSQVAALLGADPSEIVFTGSGTEGDNFAIRGVAEALEADRPQAPHRQLDRARGRAQYRSRHWPVAAGGPPSCRSMQSGIVSPDELNKALADDTALVSIMHANNEIGTIQPITELAALAHERGARSSTPTRCSQRAKSRSTSRRSVWICSRSRRTSSTGRKASARCGSGGASACSPPLTGGKQERSRRAGTENVAGIVGMGVAAREARRRRWQTERRRLAALRDRLEAGSCSRVTGTARQRRGRAARAQHDEHQLRSSRSRVAAHRARPRRHRRVHRFGMLVGHARTVSRAEGDGTCPRIARRTRFVSAWEPPIPTPTSNA